MLMVTAAERPGAAETERSFCTGQLSLSPEPDPARQPRHVAVQTGSNVPRYRRGPARYSGREAVASGGKYINSL